MQNFTHGYALLIGVGESAFSKFSLPVTVKNTQAIHAALIDPELCGYAENNIKVLNNKEATQTNILKGLEWLKRLADQDSQATIFIYYSGHGWVDKTDNSYYLVQHDVKPSELASSALSGTKFTKALGDIKAERLFVVIDSCYAAGMATSESPEEFENFQPINPPKGLVSEWKKDKGRVVFTSSQGEQKSWIKKDNSMSIYTFHFLEALQGAGNKPGDTEVTFSNLMKHLSKTVPKTAQDLYNQEQIPHFDLSTTDFAIANLRGGKGLPDIDWRSVCQRALDTRKQRLTTNPLTTGDDIEFELDDIYVPLGLVQRVKKDKISGEISPESDSQMDQSEVTLTYEINQFFTQVLKQGQSLRSQGRKLAIVGKPGAGKTTLLQKLAQLLIDEKEYVIWVSLANLKQDQTLQDYLLKDWLEKYVVPEPEDVTPDMKKDMKKDLKRLFRDTSKRVFLLLDGIDEMTMTSGDPLAKLQDEISDGWIANARVVVTCRQNVWDAEKNSLVGFDVYRNLDFAYPDGMKTFIQGWFKKPELAKLGERLMEELGQPEQERIRDMVRNPLRLALLCRACQIHQGNLPNTKAGLYKQFTDTLYDWRSNENNENNQEKLNIALSNLALRGMEQSECRFRFKEDLVIDFLGKKDDTLFELALELGWLNKGVATENPDEQVYAFYHPTFQEYFAALAIDDWSYFLKSNRIFEKQWKEVILLWFGRDDVEKKEKEAFIKKLIKLDNVDKSDKYRAYFLAGAIVREFKESRWSDEVIDQIVNYCITLDVIQEKAKAVLLETNREKAIKSLIKLLEQTSAQDKQRIITNCLRDIAVGHEGAIKSLLELLEQTSAQDKNWIIAHCLYDIAVEDEGAINSLTKLYPQTSDEEALRIMIDCWTKLVMPNKIENSNRKLLQIPLTQWLKKLINDLFSPIIPNNSTDNRTIEEIDEILNGKYRLQI